MLSNVSKNEEKTQTKIISVAELRKMVFFVLSHSSIRPDYLCCRYTHWRWDNHYLSVYSLIIHSPFSLCCDAIDSHQYVRRWGWSRLEKVIEMDAPLRCSCSCVSLVSASYGPRTSISTSWVPLIFDISVLRSLKLFTLRPNVWSIRHQPS